jgi:hypothetical protein
MEVKKATPKEKFDWIQEWHPYLFNLVKRDLRNEHLRNDPAFAKKYLGKTFPKADTQELVEGYRAAIQDGQEGLVDFLFQAWLLKKTDIYHYFAEELSKISEDFTELDTLDSQVAKEISDKAVHQFGALDTILFALMNGVVFPPSLFEELKKKAHEEERIKKKNADEQAAIKDREDLIRDYELRLQRLMDKYEKKLLGMEKKYHNDTAALKKQLKR